MGGGGHMRETGKYVLSAVLFLSSLWGATARAQGEESVPAEQSAGEKEAVQGPVFTPSARFVARASADEREEFRRDLGVDSARLGVHAEYKFLDAVLEADLSSTRSPLRDAFARVSAEENWLRFSAGRFKAPFLARNLRSTWKLALQERGMINDLLVDDHGFGGRRLGAMLEARALDKDRLRIYGGVFEGSEDELGGRLGEDAAVRATYKVSKRLEFGTSGYAPQAFTAQRRGAASLDVRAGRYGFVFEGELVAAKLQAGEALGALGLMSYELPLSSEGAWRLRPVVGGELLRLRGPVAGQGFASTFGLGVLFEDRFRADLQLERALKPADRVARNEWSLQLGMWF